MSEHLMMMYKFWLMNTTNTSVITEDDIVNAISYSSMPKSELDKLVKDFYTNFTGICTKAA